MFGQQLYTDFYIPNGPIAALLLLPFAYLFASGWALCLSCGLLGGLATVTIYCLLSRHCLSKRQITGGTILTAVWFAPPMGGYYHDHLAFLFVLLSLFRRHSPLLLSLAVHTKITIGLPASIVCLGTTAFYGPPKITLKAILEFLGWNLVLLCLWTLLFDWDGFWLSTWHRPKTYFGPFPENLAVIALRMAHTIALPFRIDPILMIVERGWGRLIFYPVVIAVYFCFYKIWKDRDRLLFELVLTSLVSGTLLGRSFAHLFFGLGGAIAISCRRRITIVAPILIASGVILTVQGRGMMSPSLQEGRQGIGQKALYPLRVTDHFRTRSLISILRILESEHASYYLTDNGASLLPIALGYPALNSCIDYHDGTGIPTERVERLEWQSERVKELSERQPRYVVWDGRREKMRIVKEYLRGNYKVRLQTEAYQLWERRT